MIVGGGLAGSILAYQLLTRGIDFVIFDAKSTKASDVAAGMYNPIVFRRLVKSWMADQLIPYTRHFYNEMQSILGNLFFHPTQYYKIMGEQEESFWITRSKLEDTQPYLSAAIEFPEGYAGVKHPYGMAQVFSAGWVNLKEMISGLHRHFALNNQLVHEVFDYSKLKMSSTGVVYGNWEASRIIFCEGSYADQNRWFSDIPYKHTRGEVLTIHSPALNVNVILNKNGFILPLGNDLYKVGATYDWDDLLPATTDRGKAALIEKLENIISVPYKIVKHEAGIRPTTKDRRPVMGEHHEHKNVFIFNGLGTKGVMLAPYFSNQLVEHIFHGEPLNPEVDVRRFFNQ